jgi:hypothetical protein
LPSTTGYSRKVNRGDGIIVKGRIGIRRRKLQDDLEESREYSNLKEEALDRKTWRARFRRGLDLS